MDADQPVPPSASVRVSDVERDGVVELLKERTADGSLTLDEFAGRVDRALSARSRGDLDALTADLRTPAQVNVPRRKLRHTVLAVMGGANTKGRWRCGQTVTAVAVMGGCHLDFRGAEIDAREVHVTAIAVMGGIDIVVPEGIDVTMDGLPVMGGRALQVKDVPLLPGSPRIVVHAFPIMGGVTVRSRPRSTASVDAAPVPELAAPRESPETSSLPLDGTVTVMFSDLSDYSGITDRLGDASAHELLREHNALIRAHVAAHGGHVIKANGDGFMLAFTSVARALRCAVTVQHALAERNRRVGGEPIRVHIGVHAGEVVRDGDDLLGGTVIVASRLADVAHPEEILVSSLARELTNGNREFVFDRPRSVSLKGFADDRQAYPVRWELAELAAAHEADAQTYPQ